MDMIQERIEDQSSPTRSTLRRSVQAHREREVVHRAEIEVLVRPAIAVVRLRASIGVVAAPSVVTVRVRDTTDRRHGDVLGHLRTLCAYRLRHLVQSLSKPLRTLVDRRIPTPIHARMRIANQHLTSRYYPPST